MAGSTTPSASETATEASIALPPHAKHQGQQMWLGWLVATAPFSPIISGRFDFYHFCILVFSILNYLILFIRILDKEAEDRQLQELYASIGRTSHLIEICLPTELILFQKESPVPAS